MHQAIENSFAHGVNEAYRQTGQLSPSSLEKYKLDALIGEADKTIDTLFDDIKKRCAKAQTATAIE